MMWRTVSVADLSSGGSSDWIRCGASLGRTIVMSSCGRGEKACLLSEDSRSVASCKCF